MKKIVLFGAPGVGKGTFAELLSKKEKLKHINVGNLLREEIKKESSIGKEVSKLVKNGYLVSDNIIIDIVNNEIKKCNVINKELSYNGFILDGFPRNMFQSEELIKITKIDLFVNIYLPKYILIKKLLGRRICSICQNNFNVTNIQDNNYDMPPLLPSTECLICKGETTNLTKRSDDKKEIIEHRLNTYESNSLPIINFFKNSNFNFVNFEVKKGIKDFDDFYNIIIKYF
ncbi:GTP:AMP phosphotransferase [Hepatocystis sp. ex Piliocolobus tephrosceles]|nr:GTP:AMP phosphotransferase [Hepatocystis sp. ex Piliocolobus tephrosceles]